MDDASPTRSPASAAQMAWVFTRLALQGFGGVLPVAQRELVEREGWLTREQFVEMLSVAQVLPGPNVVNLAVMIGDRFFGLRGVAAAMGGLLLAPLILVLLLAALYGQLAQVPVVAGALRGMGLVAAGLVIATAFKLAPTLKKSPLGGGTAFALAAATLVMVGLLRWPMVWVVLGLGACGMALAWRGLSR